MKSPMPDPGFADQKKSNYDKYYTIIAAGVSPFGLMTCLRCGAAVIQDKADAVEIHNKWHARQLATADAANRGDRHTRRFD
jgi:hypothetical protein